MVGGTVGEEVEAVSPAIRGTLSTAISRLRLYLEQNGKLSLKESTVRVFKAYQEFRLL